MGFSIIDVLKGVFKNGFGYKVFVSEDETNSSLINYQMHGNFTRIVEGNLGSGGNIDISGDAYISKNAEISLYGILVKCNVKDGLYFLQRNAFQLNVDGKEFNFNLSDNFYSIDEFSNFGDKYFIEIDRFLIDKGIMKLIADSTNVEFKIYGQKQTIEGYLSDKNIRRFRDFYYDYLP